MVAPWIFLKNVSGLSVWQIICKRRPAICNLNHAWTKDHINGWLYCVEKGHSVSLWFVQTVYTTGSVCDELDWIQLIGTFGKLCALCAIYSKKREAADWFTKHATKVCPASEAGLLMYCSSLSARAPPRLICKSATPPGGREVALPGQSPASSSPQIGIKHKQS